MARKPPPHRVGAMLGRWIGDRMIAEASVTLSPSRRSTAARFGARFRLRSMRAGLRGDMTDINDWCPASHPLAFGAVTCSLPPMDHTDSPSGGACRVAGIRGTPATVRPRRSKKGPAAEMVYTGLLSRRTSRLCLRAHNCAGARYFWCGRWGAAQDRRSCGARWASSLKQTRRHGREPRRTTRFGALGWLGDERRATGRSITQAARVSEASPRAARSVDSAPEFRAWCSSAMLNRATSSRRASYCFSSAIPRTRR